jgi:membrane protein YqaA with SNARE-associated domain
MNQTIAINIGTAHDRRAVAHQDPARVNSQLWRKEYAGVLAKLAPVAIVLGGSILMVWAMFQYRDTVANLGPWRYAGVFLAELGNSAAILFPTPGPAFTLSMALVLNPILLGIIGGIGATLGELTGYYLGRKGSKVIEGGRIYKRFQAIAGNRMGLALFSFSMLPVPLDFAGLWAGTVRYPVLKFLAAIVVGKTMKIMVLAYAASYGLSWLG